MTDKGFIREKLDIKYLILFVLSSFDDSVTFDEVAESVLVDEAITFFDVTEAFFEVVDSGHAEKDGSTYRISRKGLEIIPILEPKIPASVKRKAQHAILNTARRKKRNSYITCKTETTPDGELITTLKINDDQGEIIGIDIMVLNRQQSAILESNFKMNAERIYNELITVLLKDYSLEEQNND